MSDHLSSFSVDLPMLVAIVINEAPSQQRHHSAPAQGIVLGDVVRDSRFA